MLTKFYIRLVHGCPISTVIVHGFVMCVALLTWHRMTGVIIIAIIIGVKNVAMYNGSGGFDTALMEVLSLN